MTLTDNDDELIFEEEDGDEEAEAQPIAPWKMMIVDDVEDIHHVTRMIFEDYMFDGRHLQFLSAYSGQEARQLMAEHPDTALILLDVVMETDHAGLDVVRYIREDLQNEFVRIILRTGQPGQAPEKKVIIEYDINDYKTKEELTSNKLFTAVTSALRSCRDMNVIERNRKGLEMIINASSSLLKLPSLKQFTSGVLTQLTSILGFEDNSLLLQTADGTCGFAATAAQGNYKIIAGTGHYGKYVNQCVTDLDDEKVMADINQAISRKMNNFKDKRVVLITHGPPYKTKLDKLKAGHVGNMDYRIFIERIKPLMAISGHLHDTMGEQDEIGDTILLNPCWEGVIIEL